MVKISAMKSGASRSTLECSVKTKNESAIKDILQGYPIGIRREQKECIMPKRKGNLYQKALDKKYIKSIIYRAAHRREKRPDIARVLARIDSCVDRIYSMLLNDSFVPHEPRVVEIFDESSQKRRKIQMLPFFPDCIIQWIVIDLLMPVLMRGMDNYSCSSIPKRGGSRIYRRLRGYIRRNHKNAKHAVQIDVHHYYDNIDIDKLMQMLRRKCKDERLLALVEKMVRATSPDGKGLAIGFYLNQWLANFYLENIDRMFHRGNVAGCYVRYMDNMTVIGRNKRKLRKKMHEIIEGVKEYGLEIKPDYQIFPLSKRDIKAVGYRFYGNGRISLRKRNWLKFRRQMLRIVSRLKIGTISPKIARSFLSRFGNLKHVSRFTVFSRYISKIDFTPIRKAAA